jgi:hypothetical protein
MFENKRVKTIEKPFVVEPKFVNPLVHVVDVNMVITKSKGTEEQMFKDRDLIKKKFTTKWEEEQNLQKYFAKTTHEMQAKDPPEGLNQKEKT